MAYWKPGNRESGTGSGTGRGIGEILRWNECFKLGSMIDIKTLSSLLCIPRKMDDDTRSPFKKCYEYKERSSYHSFQLDWVWDDALIIQTYLLLGRDKTGKLAEMWVRVKHFWLHNLCKTKTLTLYIKTRLVFPTIDRNAEILSGGFNDLFSCC